MSSRRATGSTSCRSRWPPSFWPDRLFELRFPRMPYQFLRRGIFPHHRSHPGLGPLCAGPRSLAAGRGATPDAAGLRGHRRQAGDRQHAAGSEGVDDPPDAAPRHCLRHGGYRAPYRRASRRFRAGGGDDRAGRPVRQHAGLRAARHTRSSGQRAGNKFAAHGRSSARRFSVCRPAVRMPPTSRLGLRALAASAKRKEVDPITIMTEMRSAWLYDQVQTHRTALQASDSAHFRIFNLNANAARALLQSDGIQSRGGTGGGNAASSGHRSGTGPV